MGLGRDLSSERLNLIKAGRWVGFSTICKFYIFKGEAFDCKAEKISFSFYVVVRERKTKESNASTLTQPSTLQGLR